MFIAGKSLALTPYPHDTSDGISIKTTTYSTSQPLRLLPPTTESGVTPQDTRTPLPIFPKEADPKFLEFEISKIRQQYSLGRSPKRLTALISHWRAAQVLMTSTKLGILGLGDAPDVCYSYFVETKTSPGYALKILAILNKFGVWLDRRNFTPIPPPTRFDKERIVDAFTEGGAAKASSPITPEILLHAKRTMKSPHYRWIFLSLWLGLRPGEVDSLKNPEMCKVTDEDGTPVLHVYQSKLRQLPKAERWKYIPLLLPQQIFALKIIQSGKFRRPVLATIHRWLGNGIHLYGGRKGFAGALMGEGLKIEAVSYMLGHKNVETTLSFYASRAQVQLDRIRRLK